MKTRPHLSSPAVVTRRRWRHTSPPQEAAAGVCVSRRPARPALRYVLAVLATVTVLALATAMATNFARRWIEARDAADCDGLRDLHDAVRRLGLDGLDEFLDTCVSPAAGLRATLHPFFAPLLKVSEAVCAQLRRAVQLLTRLGEAAACLGGVAVRRRCYEFVAAMTPAADEGLTAHTVMDVADMGDTTDTDKDAPVDLQQKSQDAMQPADHRTDVREEQRKDLRHEPCEDPSRDHEFHEDPYYDEDLYEDLHCEKGLQEDLYYEDLYEEDLYSEQLYEEDHLNKYLTDEDLKRDEDLYNEHLYEGLDSEDKCAEDLDLEGFQDGKEHTPDLVRVHTQSNSDDCLKNEENNTKDAHSQVDNTDDDVQHSQYNTQHAQDGEHNKATTDEDSATHAHDELDQPYDFAEEYTRNGNQRDSFKDFL